MYLLARGQVRTSPTTVWTVNKVRTCSIIKNKLSNGMNHQHESCTAALGLLSADPMAFIMQGYRGSHPGTAVQPVSGCMQGNGRDLQQWLPPLHRAKPQSAKYYSK